MKLTEKQAFKIVDETLGWLGIEVIKENQNTGIGQVKDSEISDFIMQRLINIEL